VAELKNISIQDYTYHLPINRIAPFPLAKRDESKLLVYDKGEISQDIFKNISSHIPTDSLLIFNDTKVVNARLLFKNKNGKVIEIFCVDPAGKDLYEAFQKNVSVEWICMVGGAKAWKDETLELRFTADGDSGTLRAEILKREAETFTVKFSWEPLNMTFSEVLSLAGVIPLPPYIKRQPTDEDKITYQTIYANTEGSVASPTAGLHFTDEVFQSLKNKNINMQNVTLHVGSGTFKPVKSAKLSGHRMHSERFYIEKKVIEDIMGSLNPKIIAVGTTSLRTIESLYWFGVQLIETRAGDDIQIGQWEPYEKATAVTAAESLEAVLDQMQKNKMEYLSGSTGIIITPGYEFKFINGLITNFHQPGSTLLLLIAAFLGDRWKKVYEYALNNDFRFLSYGDSSILFR